MGQRRQVDNDRPAKGIDSQGNFDCTARPAEGVGLQQLAQLNSQRSIIPNYQGDVGVIGSGFFNLNQRPGEDDS
jgi:hypothetical protein